MSLFDPLALDPLKPLLLKPSLAQWDNYQIYTLICTDYPHKKTTLPRQRREPRGFAFNDPFGETRATYHAFTDTIQAIENPVYTFDNFLAYQKFGVDQPLIDFGLLAQQLIVKPRSYYNYTSVTTTTIKQVSGVLPDGYSFTDYQTDVNNVAATNEIDSDNQFTFIDTYNRSNYGYYSNTSISHTIYQDIYTHHDVSLSVPSYLSLVYGYYLDNRVRPPANPLITINVSGSLKIGYYKWNKYERIENLTSIDWRVYEIKFTKNIPCVIPITDCVLGTLVFIGDSTLVNLVKSELATIQLPTNSYQWSDYYFGGRTQALFGEWVALYNAIELQPEPPDVWLIYQSYREFTDPPIFRRLSANNNWINDNLNGIEADLNPQLDHPMFEVNQNRAYRDHFRLQTDGSLGDIQMDSPRIVEMHTALNAAKYAVNDLDNTTDRVSTLGYYIEKISSLLGHRVDANGEVDLKKEAEIVPQLLNKPRWKQGDTSYSQFCFGQKGIIVPSLPTSYDKSGKLLELYHICHDIPQLLSALQSDIDKSLGIEQGSQIRVKGLDGKIVPFQNQLAMAIDNQQKIQILSDRIEKLYGQNLVQGQELRGLYAGIGIPVSVEKLPVTDAKGKVKTYLPYFTYQQSQSSILGHLTAIKMNLSIVLGVLMPKAENKSINPFKRLLGKK
jgi:hypothetical protein